MVVDLLQVVGITRRFGSHLALDDVSFSVPKGEILGVIGRSGAGKSSLLRCLGALDRPDEGHIVLQGENLTELTQAQLVQARRRIGYVFQHFNLLNVRTVAGNIALPLEIAGVKKDVRHERVEELLHLVGLAGQGDKWPSQLSGGQKQRVGIARALANDPALLLCDEATSALDPETTASILQLLREINARLGLTIVLITHEMDVIRRIATQVIVLDHGRIIENGPTRQIWGTTHAVTHALLSDSRPQLPPAIEARLTGEKIPDARTIIRLRVEGDAAWEPFLSAASQRFGTDIALLQGSMVEVGGAPFADLILSLSNGTQGVLDFLSQSGRSMEVTGYVPADY